MSFVKNQAVTGFTVGMINASDGSALTTGTVNGYVTLDGGTQASLSGTITHEGNGQWSVDTITAAEMNGDIVGLQFTHASGIPVSFTIKTVPSLSGGSGADIVTTSVTDSGSGDPIDSAEVWITTDAARSNVIAGALVTDVNGEADFLLDDGSTYYFWLYKGGVNSIQGESFVASSASGNAFTTETAVAGSSASVVGIINYALDMLGQSPINSIDDDTVAARMAKRVYPFVLDSMLVEHDWKEARERVELAQLATTPAWGYAYEYQLPSDFIRLLSIDTVDGAYEISGLKVRTDLSTVKIVYVKRLEDPATMSAGFKDALAARLAAEMSVKYSDHQQQQILRATALQKISSAMFTNLIQDPVRRTHDPSLYNARRGIPMRQDTP